MWRYRELLPIDGEPTVGPHVGGTPLIRADRLAEALGVESCGSRTTRSTSRRCRSRTASSRSRCRRPSSSASRPSAAPRPATWPTASPPTPPPPGSKAYILVPDDLEQGKILGTSVYGAKVIGVDGHLRRGQPPLHADRLQVRLGLRQRQPPAVLRRGLEDDGLRDRRGPRLAAPAARRRPMAGGSLIGKIHKAFNELRAARPDRRRADARCTAPRRPAATRSPTPSRPSREASSRSASRTRSPSPWPSATRPTATSPRKLIRETGGWGEDVDRRRDRRRR